MTVIEGHYDGRQIVLAQPVPTDIPAETRVKVVFENGGARGVLREIAELARACGLPSDFSQQHDHYVRGTPRR